MLGKHKKFLQVHHLGVFGETLDVENEIVHFAVILASISPEF